MYHHILVHIDLHRPHTWYPLVTEAIGLARLHAAKLSLFEVMPEIGLPLMAKYLPKDTEAKLKQALMEQLKAFIHEHIPDDIEAEALLGEGPLQHAFLLIAEEIDADLIMLPPRYSKHLQHTLGAVAAHVVRHATCSVLVVRRPEPD